MATTIAPQRPEATLGGGGGSFPPGGFGDSSPGGFTPGAGRRIYRTGMWLALVAVTMLFVAFTSAYIVRSGLSDDWQPIGIPSILWANTVLLILSSLTLERARRILQLGLREAFNRWLSVTAILGVTFLVGQLLAWRQLTSQGIYLTTNPSSSFFYLLTGAHGVHLAVGVLALLYVTVEACRYRLGPAKRTVLEVTAIYWHFMDGLWFYILCLMLFWR